MASSGSGAAVWLLVCALANCQVASARSLTLEPSIHRGAAFGGAASNDLLTEAERTNLAASQFQGPRIIEGFTDIGASVASITTEMRSDGNRILGNADAEDVVFALRTFVFVHKRLLSVMIRSGRTFINF